MCQFSLFENRSNAWKVICVSYTLTWGVIGKLFAAKKLTSEKLCINWMHFCWCLSCNFVVCFRDNLNRWSSSHRLLILDYKQSTCDNESVINVFASEAHDRTFIRLEIASAAVAGSLLHPIWFMSFALFIFRDILSFTFIFPIPTHFLSTYLYSFWVNKSSDKK